MNALHFVTMGRSAPHFDDTQVIPLMSPEGEYLLDETGIHLFGQLTALLSPEGTYLLSQTGEILLQE
jgi:hypothetical protein